MAHHQMLTFPILAAAEIVECMDELAIPVTLADLAKVRAHGEAEKEKERERIWGESREMPSKRA